MIDRKKGQLQRQLSNNNSNKQNEQQVQQKQLGELQEETVFQVVMEEEQRQQGYVSVEKQFVLSNYRRKQVKSEKQSEEQQQTEGQETPQQIQFTTEEEENSNDEVHATQEDQNIFTFTFHFRAAVKDYICLVTLMNENKTDVRRLRLTVTSLPKPVKATIFMKVPARETVVQEIPILNQTDRDFMIRVSLTGEDDHNAHFFQILNQQALQQQQSSQTHHSQQNLQQLKKAKNKEQVIKKKTNGAILVAFCPPWVCQAEAKLTLYNPLTNDLFEYDLKAVAEEPLSEGHINLACLARQTAKHNILLHNTTDKPITYNVDTDLIYAAGEPSITLPPNTSQPYTFIVTPMLSGLYTGSITFTDVDT